MPLIVKICGLSSPEALDVALDEGADMVGFVFFPPSPRHLSFDAARMLGRRVHGRAQKVALTVDADDAWFDAIVQSLQPDMLQLHGKETAARVTALKRRFGLPAMKAIRRRAQRRPRAGGELCRRWPTVFCLMRGRRRRDAAGRARQAVRLAASCEFALGVPFMLSGGLDAGNVGEALRITRRAWRRRVLRRGARAGRERSR